METELLEFYFFLLVLICWTTLEPQHFLNSGGQPANQPLVMVDALLLHCPPLLPKLPPYLPLCHL